jgi:predicted AAA+ superfamily ATPase
VPRQPFATLVAEFQERPLPRPTPRAVPLPGLPSKADALVGMRRVGKTWRMYQHMGELLGRGVAKERLLYVNLEDERLSVTAADLSELTEAWYARHPAVVDQEHWLYLDEVQNVPGWERFVRRLLDQGNVRVLVTGSSSKMLSAEIATSLRGRALSTELLPFSFLEALAHAGVAVPTVWPVGTAERARLTGAFDTYLEAGGFPEVQGLDAHLRRRVLQEYVDVAVLRDVIERHQVTQVAALRWLVRRLLANPAGRFSAHRLHLDLQSQGIRVGKDTVHELLAHVEDAHLVYTLPLRSASAARRASNPRKAYPVDPALARTAAFAKPDDVGHRLENLVYLELRRRGVANLGYLATVDGFEVDFCGESPDGALQLVQVCASLSDPDTRARELRALEAALSEVPARSATIVTLYEEDTLQVAGATVGVVPAWRWLAEGPGGAMCG